MATLMRKRRRKRENYEFIAYVYACLRCKNELYALL